MNLYNVSTEDLRKEIFRRELNPGIWIVVKYLRDDGVRNNPKHIHLIENFNGVQTEANLIGRIYNKDLNDRQPTSSDEDPNWDSDWEEYEEYSIQYFIGRKVKIDSFYPFRIGQILEKI